jgi:hypothetical protein
MSAAAASRVSFSAVLVGPRWSGLGAADAWRSGLRFPVTAQIVKPVDDTHLDINGLERYLETAFTETSVFYVIDLSQSVVYRNRKTEPNLLERLYTSAAFSLFLPAVVFVVPSDATRTTILLNDALPQVHTTALERFIPAVVTPLSAETGTPARLGDDAVTAIDRHARLRTLFSQISTLNRPSVVDPIPINEPLRVEGTSRRLSLARVAVEATRADVRKTTQQQMALHAGGSSPSNETFSGVIYSAATQKDVNEFRASNGPFVRVRALVGASHDTTTSRVLSDCVRSLYMITRVTASENGVSHPVLRRQAADVSALLQAVYSSPHTAVYTKLHLRRVSAKYQYTRNTATKCEVVGDLERVLTDKDQRKQTNFIGTRLRLMPDSVVADQIKNARDISPIVFTTPTGAQGLRAGSGGADPTTEERKLIEHLLASATAIGARVDPFITEDDYRGANPKYPASQVKALLQASNSVEFRAPGIHSIAAVLAVGLRAPAAQVRETLAVLTPPSAMSAGPLDDVSTETLLPDMLTAAAIVLWSRTDNPDGTQEQIQQRQDSIGFLRKEVMDFGTRWRAERS